MSPLDTLVREAASLGGAAPARVIPIQPMSGSEAEVARVHFGGAPSDNLFVAGEMMAGNVLGQGYTAGVGMSIGTAFGRIAGTEAARAALMEATHAVA